MPSPPFVSRNVPVLPQFAALTSRNRLLRMVIVLVARLLFGLSCPSTLNTDATCRTMLFVNCTCCTTVHGAVPFWVRGVSTMA